MAALAPTTPQVETGALRRFLQLDLLDNRYPVLHGLRIFAVISVVQLHVTHILTTEQGVALNPVWVGQSLSIFFGMDLFFLLSGFLIGSILVHSIESTGWRTIRRFYLRRAFRTFPPYYVVLAYLALVIPLDATLRRHLVYELVYLTNFVPDPREVAVMPWGWSLSVEEQFYLVVPFLFLALRRFRGDRARLAILGVLWLGALALRLHRYFELGELSPEAEFRKMYFETHTRSDTLVAGLALAYVNARWGGPIATWLERPLNRAMVALPSMLCFWVLVQPMMFGLGAVRLFQVFAWGTLTSIMYFGWVLLLLHGGDGWFQRFLSAPVFRRIATLGYGVYLVHIPVCRWVVSPIAASLALGHHWPAGAVWLLAVPAVLAGSLACAYVLHVLVEKPSLRLRDRVAR